MGLLSFFSIICFLFTVILLFAQRRTGNLFMPFGILTFVFILIFGCLPQTDGMTQNIGIFALFSCLLVLIGIMNGITFLYFFRLPAAVSFTLTLGILLGTMLMLFNLKGWLTYLYIPVLIHLIFRRLILYREKIKQTPFRQKRPFRTKKFLS